MHHRPALVALLFVTACSPGALRSEPDFHGVEDPAPATASTAGLSLSGLGAHCSTAGTEGLSAQLLDEMQCLSDGALVRYESANIVLTSTRVHPYLSPAGRDAILRVAASHEIRINSGLRTIAEQYVLSRGCAVAAAPGHSNHETGRAIDVANYATVGRFLEAAGFARPLPSSDPVHYEASGDDLRTISVMSFQTLWNANHPEDRLAVDGFAGSATLSRLARAPAGGFPISGVCARGGALDAGPPPALDAGPPPVLDAGPPPARDAGPPPALDAGTPPARDAGARDAGPPAGPTCTHSFGGVYRAGGCSASYQCCDGHWSTRASGCGVCTCVESTGTTGC